MMFNDNLYFIASQQIDLEQNIAIFGLRLNPENVIYKAHFPSMPVTPGVCLIQIAQELFAKCIGEFCSIKRVKNVKFITILSPLETPELRATISGISLNESNEYRTTIVFDNDEQQFAKMSIIFNKCV